MSLSLEKTAALAKLDEFEQELTDAIMDLAMWREKGLTRSEGSAAQDARHEETGVSVRRRVQAAEQAVKSQKAVYAQLP